MMYLCLKVAHFTGFVTYRLNYWAIFTIVSGWLSYRLQIVIYMSLSSDFVYFGSCEASAVVELLRNVKNPICSLFCGIPRIYELIIWRNSVKIWGVLLLVSLPSKIVLLKFSRNFVNFWAHNLAEFPQILRCNVQYLAQLIFSRNCAKKWVFLCH